MTQPDPWPFEQLDFVYMPSRDPAADVAYFTEVLGGRLVFAIEGMGARVAMVEVTAHPPRILLASHLSGQRPILVYGVGDLRAAPRAARASRLDPQPCPGAADGTSLFVPRARRTTDRHL